MARSRRAALAAILASTLAVSASGCGDAVGEFRDDELRPLQQRADAQKAQLAATLDAAAPGSRKAARSLSAQLEPLERTFAELAALDPPSEVGAAYADFTEANARLLHHMRQYVAALRQGDRSDMRAAGERAKEAIGASQRALTPIYE